MSASPSSQPAYCEKHNVALVRKRVYRAPLTSGPIDPALAEFEVAEKLPHYLPPIYSEIPNEYQTEANEVLVCHLCQSKYPEKLARARKHVAERDTDVSGYFQLTSLSQFMHLRSIAVIPQSEPSMTIIRRLRADGLRWHIPCIQKWRAEVYQFEAKKYGFEFIIDRPRA